FGLVGRLLHDHGVHSHAHQLDAELVRHPYRYRHEAPRWKYPLQYPGSIPLAAKLVLAGALVVRGAWVQQDVRHGEAMDVPGSPVPVWSPGHTDGHCGFFLPDVGALFSGDALVTLDP